MNIWLLIRRELLHRKLSAALVLLSVTVATGCLVSALTLLEAHDMHTGQILARREAETRRNMAKLEDQMREAMLGLGFNIVILPAEQDLHDWYAQDYGNSYMPAEYAERLASSRIVTVKHLLPCLQQKVRWPEVRRSVILVGSPGEIPGAKKPMVQPIEPGQIVLGYELHDSLGLKIGDELKFMGRSFTVSQCYPMRGNKDDITVWINLHQVQEMLDKKGLINAILALECQCAWADLPQVREEITRILPDTQVIEQGTKALARAEARSSVGTEAKAALQREQLGRERLREQRRRLASVLVPAVMVGSGLWIAVLTVLNSRQRRSEIGLLRALGVSGRRIMLMFVTKSLVLGVIGGAAGLCVGYLTGRLFGAGGHGALAPPLKVEYVVAALIAAPTLAILSSWLPAQLASLQDPAEILRQE